MKERGMIFNEYQVRALLDGSMTQVRRPINGVRLGLLKLQSATMEACGHGAKMRSTYAITGIHVHSVQLAMRFMSESHFHGSTHLTSLIRQFLKKSRTSGIGPMVSQNGETGHVHNLAQ